MLFHRRKPRVVLYTTPTCPDCHALKAYLQKHEVPFEERDLTRPEVAEEAKRKYGVRVAPVAVIGKDVFYGTFQEQRRHLAPLIASSA